MYNVFTFFFLVILVLFLMLIFSFFVMSSVNLEYQKSSPFECGFNSLSLKRLPFSVHFFLIAVIFLIFDVEVVIILPIVIVLSYSFIYFWFMVITLFIFFLILGLYHEWYNGILSWTL